MSTLDPREEQRLRDLLDEAVADVQPRDALFAIRNRTKVTSMSQRRPWILAAGGAALATAATVTAFAVLGGTDPTVPEEPDVAGTPTVTEPPATDDPTDPTTGPDEPVETFAAPVYYVGDTPRGPRLYREWHRVDVAEGQSRGTAALNEMFGAEPFDPDYRSMWAGSGAVALSVSETAGDLTVDITTPRPLEERPTGMSTAEASMAVEQLLYTVQGALQSGRDAPVQILVDSQPTTSLFGVPVNEALAAGDPLQTEALIQVSAPLDGETVTSPFTVDGRGSSFEANVLWELRQGGTVVEKGFTTAEGWMGGLFPFSFTVEAPPGEYLLVVSADDPSGGAEGAGPDQDTKRIVVTE